MKQFARYFIGLTALLWVAMAVCSWHLLFSLDTQPASGSVQQGIYELNHNDLGVISSQQRQNTHHFSGQKQSQNLLFGSFVTKSDAKTAVSEHYISYARQIAVGLPVQNIIFPSHFFF